MSAARRVAVVTGAGSGIGRQVALVLLGDGYAVALAGRREEALRETVRLAGVAGERALVVSADVGDPDSVRALFGRVREVYGRLDVLFNNAGTMPAPTPLEQVGDEDWRSVVEVNLTGAFWCAREAFALMKEQDPQGGRIVNNGSIAAQVPRPGSVGYTATKHGITGLTKSIALEGRRYAIACGQIDIGNAATDLTAGFAQGALQADGSRVAEPTFDAAHVAQTVRHIVGLPLEANVPFLTLTATAMPFMGRG